MSRRTLAFLAVLSVTVIGFVANIETAKAAGSGSFSVLTYNVAGLPESISSAPTPRSSASTAIGERLRPYDIVNLQEDFNYHAKIYDANSHPHRTPTSGPAGRGSGLNTLSHYSFTDFDRSRWDSCQVDSGDCLTPKGFTFMRVSLAEGVDIDLYNLHTNAGTSSGDLESRADNLSQLTEYITSHSAGNAVVVMGDTNTRYTRTGDTIAGFLADNDLTDAWVQLQRNGSPPALGSAPLVCEGDTVTNACEVVDKVLYRSSSSLTLNASTYGIEHATFLDSSGRMLSDHDPVRVEFSWTQA